MAAIVFDGGPITFASALPAVTRLPTLCLILLGSLMDKEYPPAALSDELDRSPDQALFLFPPGSPADAVR